MNLVSDLDLPAFDYAEPAAPADQIAGFLGVAPDGPPRLGGIEGIYGIGKLPVSWPGTSAMSPNHGRAPDVS
ncbi:MAG TPA: hypothetical protein VGI96_16995 [Streptosporangiaceae bacterium]|jgi:hypothetical protein